MTSTSPSPDCAQSFLGARHERHERRTWVVVGLTLVMMVGEIIGGTVFGSMALVADGWHMATHAGALGVAALAYRYARLHARDPLFTFGTGKVGELAGFASAVSLGLVSLAIGYESLERLIQPQPIDFLQATGIAVLGLVVNLISAALLHDSHGHVHDHDHDDHGHEHDHDHEHEHEHEHADNGRHHDTNLRAAYLHVIADALTSVLAIGALLAGRYLGWNWADALIGILGAIVIAHWAIGLARRAARSLLDAQDNLTLRAEIRKRIGARGVPGESIRDLHLWRLAPGHDALILSIEATQPASPDDYKRCLVDLPTLSHITVEVNPSPASAGA
ncbi:MAG: CDF family Co(II)/Ni(II) efflux transporter DmeF [Steroidobacteraceae bacterium]